MAIEIELYRVDLSHIRQDPLISQPEREEYLYGLLGHRLSSERWLIQQKLGQNEHLDPLEQSFLKGKLRAMDKDWLFANPSRVLYYAWDLLRDDNEGRQNLFGRYTEERFPDHEAALKELDSLQQRFAELKNPPPTLPQKKNLTALTTQDRPLTTSETPPITFVMAGLNRVNRGVKPIGDVRELAQVLSPDPNFVGLRTQSLWNKLQQIGMMEEEDLERLARVGKGRLTGWYITSLDENWQILFQEEDRRLTFRVSHKQS